MVFKKGELQLLWPFYISELLDGAGRILMPFLILYFRGLGFSFTQIGILSVTLFLSIFLFEIPTGVFADRISRKYSVIIGQCIVGLTAVGLAFFSNFYMISMLWFLSGIGFAFISGAGRSWVIDNLAATGNEHLKQEYLIKSQSIFFLGFIFAPLLGAAAYTAIGSYPYLWFGTAISYLLAALILLIFAKEHFNPKEISLKVSYKIILEDAKEGFKFISTHKTVLFLVLGSLLSVFMLLGADGWQPALETLLIPTTTLGLMYSALGVIGIVVPFGSKLFKRMKVHYDLSITLFLRMLILFLFILLVPGAYFYGIIIFLITEALNMMKDPLWNEYFHSFVNSKNRATVDSISNMLHSLIIAITSLLGGLLMDVLSPQSVISLGGLFALPAIFFYLKIKKVK